MSSQDRLDGALAQIAVKNADWRIVTALDEPGARTAAAESDARHATGRSLGPLDGVLVGVKDNIAVCGLPWTAGLSHWQDRIADEDAEAVARLRRAGAVILGTLNMHEGALGATTDNPTYGRCANPLDPTRTPGGSSGGSGAAVAAGWVAGALGTDTIGSVRLPAAYCGVFGFKPTTGSVPDAGLVHLAPSLDTIGPLAQDVPLVTAMHAAIADPAGRLARAGTVSGVVGLPRQLDSVAIEPEVGDALAQAAAVLEAQGIETRDVDLAGWDPGRARRGGLMLTEAEGAIALAEAMASDGGMSDHLRGLLDYGRNLTSAQMVEALARIRRAARSALAALAEVDLLLLPTAPQRAYPHGSEVPSNQADLTALANFAGLPAISLPVASRGLPVAVQLVGPPQADAQVLAAAARLAPKLQPAEPGGVQP